MIASSLIAAVLTASSASPTIETAIAPAAQVSIPLSYAHKLTSKRNGITYDLTIYLPRHYNSANAKRYPVLYFVPGGIFGPYLSQIARYLESGDIPDIIIVGIDFESDESYSFDLPTAGSDPHWTVPADRGAGNFLRVLLDEIKPSIDRDFPTDPTDTGIGGHSLGGFFALYALFNSPGTFRHVYASSPSFIWQDFALLREERRLALTASDLPARVFVDQGGLEGDDGRMETLTRDIEGRFYPSLRWHSERVPNQTHQTIAFANGINALYSVYGPTLRQASEQELADLSGHYRGSNGKELTLQREYGHLYVAGLGDAGRTELVSDRVGHWFIRYVWTDIEVQGGSIADRKLLIRFSDTPGPNGAASSPITADPAVDAGKTYRVALHCAGQAAAERLRRELQRPSTRRMPQRDAVRLARPCSNPSATSRLPKPNSYIMLPRMP